MRFFLFVYFDFYSHSVSILIFSFCYLGWVLPSLVQYQNEIAKQGTFLDSNKNGLKQIYLLKVQTRSLGKNRSAFLQTFLLFALEKLSHDISLLNMLNAPFSTSPRKSANSVELAISKFEVPRPFMIIHVM